MKKSGAELAAVLCDRCGTELLSGTLVTLSVYCRRCRKWSEKPTTRAARKVETPPIASPAKNGRPPARSKR
jgi:hypothetical protein